MSEGSPRVKLISCWLAYVDGLGAGGEYKKIKMLQDLYKEKLEVGMNSKNEIARGEARSYCP
jgi:hypothetical protein